MQLAQHRVGQSLQNNTTEFYGIWILDARTMSNMKMPNLFDDLFDDKNGGSREKFQEISTAYSALETPEKRKQYDFSKNKSMF